ncbi:hypothetical protein TorRG33x02_035140 [Trema orientale]|uniref:Uncharacterized protein n=1 Tax=Trema orientale TaxID=63057 RepID=A0A2P5FSV9_TREOI|nr:hypothetical protein TorRG33x02_035140 [Trema orientale]
MGSWIAGSEKKKTFDLTKCSVEWPLQLGGINDYGIVEPWIRYMPVLVDLIRCLQKWLSFSKWAEFTPFAFGNNGCALVRCDAGGLYCYNPNNNGLECFSLQMSVTGCTNYVRGAYPLN